MKKFTRQVADGEEDLMMTRGAQRLRLDREVDGEEIESDEDGESDEEEEFEEEEEEEEDDEAEGKTKDTKDKSTTQPSYEHFFSYTSRKKKTST